MQRRLRATLILAGAAAAIAAGTGTAFADDSDGPVNHEVSGYDQGDNGASPTIGTEHTGNVVDGENLLSHGDSGTDGFGSF
ncbi:MAG TPA: hypothetical protein VGH99_15785 [Pseudonocardia sp.]|jgi:hypothetical protein